MSGFARWEWKELKVLIFYSPQGFPRIEPGFGFVGEKKNHLSVRKLKSCLVCDLGTSPLNTGCRRGGGESRL